MKTPQELARLMLERAKAQEPGAPPMIPWIGTATFRDDTNAWEYRDAACPANLTRVLECVEAMAKAIEFYAEDLAFFHRGDRAREALALWRGGESK